MTNPTESPDLGPWAIVLAGGDGMRLRPLVDRLYADGRPKQFASLIGPRSLLGATLDRVACFASADRTVVVTMERHRAFAEAELGSAAYRTLEQPANRGTAAAILWAAIWVERREPGATVVVVPSDHHLADDRGIADHLLALASLTESDPDRIFLLGARPARPETGYGWIEPGDVIEEAGSRPIHEVRRFLEKPAEDAARAMLQQGWLWSTLILVARATTLTSVGRNHLPSVLGPIEQAMRAADGQPAEAALRRAYAGIRGADFSRDMLELVPERLGVSILSDLEWSDLGTPERVLAAVRAPGSAPVWTAYADLADKTHSAHGCPASPGRASMRGRPSDVPRPARVRRARARAVVEAGFSHRGDRNERRRSTRC